MELKFLSPNDADLSFYCNPINHLIRELSPESGLISHGYLLKMINKSRVLVAMDNGQMVGMGILIPEIKASGTMGVIHDVVVAKSRQGDGIGKSIMDRLEHEAVRLGLPVVGLTSHPSRLAANELYRNRGYQKRETNVYSKLLCVPGGF